MQKATRWNIRIIVIGLCLVAFPILIGIVFYASRRLLPSLENFQFTLPTQHSNNGFTESTIQRPKFNSSLPNYLNFSLPNFPSITYSDLLILVSAIVLSYAFIQALRAFVNRRANQPLSDIDVLIEDREKVAAILDDTVRKLSLGSNYRDTVLKCYKSIAQTLEARSSLDARTLTATEFKEIVSKKLKFESVHLSRVTSLFEVARYSENEITEGNANEAMTCLSSLSRELRSKDLVPAG